MFQSSKKRLEALRGAVDGVLAVVDDMLVGAPPEDLAETWETVAPHPHRRPVRLRIERRDGTISPRPMDCLSPVRGSAATPAPAERDLAR